jgi:hypothetical protein
MNAATFAVPARLLLSRLIETGTPGRSGIRLRGRLAPLGLLCMLGVRDLACAAGPSSASQSQQLNQFCDANYSPAIPTGTTKSMARLVFPSSLELKRPEGSFLAAPVTKVIFTTFL